MSWLNNIQNFFNKQERTNASDNKINDKDKSKLTNKEKIAQTEKEIAKIKQELAWDAAQAGVDIAGFADPTPTSDLISAGISAKRGDWLGFGASIISVVPYAGDIIGKSLKGTRTVTRMTKLAELTKSIDNLKALDKVADSAKILDKATDNTKVLEKVTDVVKTTEKGSDAAKNKGSLTTAWQIIKETGKVVERSLDYYGLYAGVKTLEEVAQKWQSLPQSQATTQLVSVNSVVPISKDIQTEIKTHNPNTQQTFKELIHPLTNQSSISTKNQNSENIFFSLSNSDTKKNILHQNPTQSPRKFIDIAIAFKIIRLADRLGNDTEIGRIYQSEEFIVRKSSEGIYSAFDTQGNPLMQTLKDANGIPQILFQNSEITDQQQISLLAAPVPLQLNSELTNQVVKDNETKSAFNVIEALTKNVPEINGVKQFTGNMYNFQVVNDREYRIHAIAEGRGLIFQGHQNENGQKQVNYYNLNLEDENRLQSISYYLEPQQPSKRMTHPPVLLD